MTETQILPGAHANQAADEMKPADIDDRADDGTAASEAATRRPAWIPRELVFRALI